MGQQRWNTSAHQVRTSVSHPLRIDEVSAGDTGGLIGITFCPGKHGDSNSGFCWERDLKADLDVIASWRAKAIVTLLEDREFTLLRVPDLGREVSQRGIEWYHLPIVDVGVPDKQFEIAWRLTGPRLMNILREGAKVLVHCRGGLGRAGTVAACLLVEIGVPAREAIRRVRAARLGAIETAAQENYVLNMSRDT